MSWKATLDSTQVRQFRAALNCFNKIGSELLIEAVPSKLILRSLNSSRSAFAAITFHNGFFDAHAIFDSRDVKGSVLIKHALALFKTQRIQKLMLHLDTKSSEHLIATVISETGLDKEFKIPCIDTEILQATVDRDSLPTHVIASAKELHKLLSSFQANLEEITLIALPETMHDGRSSNAVQLHSYLDPSKRKADAALHTQISVNTEVVFISFQHTADEAADVTFNLRDFRVMLAWCMSMEMDMAIRFQSPGAPLLVEPHCAHGDMDIEAQLVLATLLESQAHRAITRKAPATAGNTTLKTYFKTPGQNAGHTPHVPGDTPAFGAQATGNAHQRAPGTTVGQPAGMGRSRFAPEQQRQPSFETPARETLHPDPAAAKAPPPAFQKDPRRSSAQPAGLQDDMAPAAGNRMQHSDAPATSNTQLHSSQQPALPASGGYFGSLGNGHGHTESFEDDDLEDNGPPILRSRYDPRGLAADDEEGEDDDDAIPGTP